ncbi:MAG: hypothetical protein RIK87_08680 [Fuerstiella sp.]
MSSDLSVDEAIFTTRPQHQPCFARKAAAAQALTAACLVLAVIGPGEAVEVKPTPTVHRTGIDLDGHLHRFAQTPDCRAVVFVFLSTHCPISNGSLPELMRIAARWQRQHVEFYAVISDPFVSRTAAIDHRATYRIRVPVLFDGSLELRRWLKPSHTPQAIILSPQGEICYSGRIDNRFTQLGRRRDAATVHDLSDALEAVTRGRPVPVSTTVPVGCPLETAPRADAVGEVTFNRDIAPLMFAWCAECHRPGEAAPFSLLTYQDAAAHARQLVNVTQSGFMPPWHPARDFGHFQDERRLSKSQIDLVRRWVAEDCPQGAADELPPVPDFARGWRLKRPDLILQMPESFQLTADGADVHQHFVLPTGLKKNRLVAAVEFQPGNPRVVHHACFYIDTTGAARKLDQRDPDVGYGNGPGPGFQNINSLRSWLPGMSPGRLPPGTGQPLDAHSDLVLEIHYQKSGKPERDRSTVGIHFAERSARQMVCELQVMAGDLDIPAGATRHRHHASYTLPAAASLLDTAPHMHLLGREMKATATLPDGNVRPLIWIRNWDFNWQGQYLYVNPVRLPAGTRIDVDAWYDNSKHNPLNPHSPPQRVTWGEQTHEEMGVCHFRYTCDTLEELQRMNRHHLQYCSDQQTGQRRVRNSPE